VHGVSLVDTDNGATLGKPFIDHALGYHYLFFSPDKKNVLMMGEEGTATLWNSASNAPLSDPIPGTYSPLGADAAFSPKDGAFVMLQDYNSGTVVLVNVSSQKVIAGPIAGNAVVFSPDGKLVAVGNLGTNTTTVWDLVAEREVISAPGMVLTSTPDASSIFALADPTANTTTFWSWETLEPAAAPVSGSDEYNARNKTNIVVVPDSVNSRMSFWDLRTLQQVGETLTGFEPSFCPDGTLVSLAGPENNTTIILETETWQQVGATIPGFYSGSDLVFSTDCTKVAIVDRSIPQVILLDVMTGKELGKPIEGDTVVFSMDGSKMAVGDNANKTTTFWDVNSLRQIGDTADAGSVYYIPGKNDILQIYNDTGGGTTMPTMLWNINTGTQVGDQTYPYSYYPTIDWDGRLVAYNATGATIWDVKTNTMLGELELAALPSAPIDRMLFSPDGKLLASLANDGIVLTTNLATHSGVHLDTGEGPVQFNGQMAFSSEAPTAGALPLLALTVRFLPGIRRAIRRSS
jgi:WD40 repeat protein